MNVVLLLLGLLIAVLLGAVVVLLMALLRRPVPLQRADLPPTLTPDSLESVERRLTEQFTQRLASLEMKEDNLARAQREELSGTLKNRFEESTRLMEAHLKEVRDRLKEMGGINDGMQRLGEGVSRFNALLANVKVRGVWGEVQLERILEEFFVPGQYERNVKPTPRSTKFVEFAIALPGTEEGKKIWLPIDSKFPVEDYERLLAAKDAETAENARKALVTTLKKFATDVTGYIAPPYTTNFAILFVPTEGLFLEAARDVSLQEHFQSRRILLAGPQTLAALLNALQMGFKTLAVQKQSDKAWKLLAKTKKHLDDYVNDCDAAIKKLEESINKVTTARGRIETISRELRTVTVPEEETPHA